MSKVCNYKDLPDPPKSIKEIAEACPLSAKQREAFGAYGFRGIGLYVRRSYCPDCGHKGVAGFLVKEPRRDLSGAYCAQCLGENLQFED